MSEEKRCKFCNRNILEVSKKEYYSDNGEYICKDCGVGDMTDKEQEVEEGAEQVTTDKMPTTTVVHPDVENFSRVLPYAGSWRNHQINNLKLTTKELSKVNIERFLIKIEDRLFQIKGSLLNGKEYEARIGLLDLATSALSYFEAHPFDLNPDQLGG